MEKRPDAPRAARGHPSIREFLSMGYTHITHSEIVNYSRFFPALDLMHAQIEPKVRSTLRRRDEGTQVLGHIVASWGDQGGKVFRELNYYGYAFGAEITWSPEQAARDDFSKKFMGALYNRKQVRYLRCCQF